MTNPTHTSQSSHAFDPNEIHSLNRVLYEPFAADRTQPIWQALDRNIVEQNTKLLVMDLPQTKAVVSLIKEQMAYHHVAQGQLHEQPWLLCYCERCNTAAGFDPVLDEQLLTFTYGGHYEGMTFIQDAETRSFWNFLTGQCVSGDLKGKQLKSNGFVNHLQAHQVARTLFHTHIAVSQPNLRSRFLAPLLKAPADNKPACASTDARRPELDDGLGIWDNVSARYYPLEILQQHDNIIFDKLNGRDLLITVDPISKTPFALDMKPGKTAWTNEKLWLQGDLYIQDGQLFDLDGNKQTISRPFQIFSRWFAFSKTFPNCEISTLEPRTIIA